MLAGCNLGACTAEIGVRMALGARRTDFVSMVAGRALLLTTMGHTYIDPELAGRTFTRTASCH